MIHAARKSFVTLSRCGWRLALLAAIATGLAVATPARGAAQEVDKEAESQDEGQPSAPQRHAYKLGEFRIKNFRPVEREKVTLTFTVWVEVADENYERFEQAYGPRQHRLRNQVITSARLVPPTAFEDATLQTFRRRIYLRLRRAVPELPIAEVFISDFSYIVE